MKYSDNKIGLNGSLFNFEGLDCMEYRKLGRTELNISSIGLGTWAFNSLVYGPVEKGAALKTIRTGIDEGINFFDTAPLYGNKKNDGIAETIVGEGLKGYRQEMIISSKFGRKPTQGNRADFCAQSARTFVEESLRRLATDYIDILFFHSPFSANEIQDDVWRELDRLKEEGSIRFVGHSISMFDKTEQMAREWAEERKIDVIQVVYSLLFRQSENLIRNLGEKNIGIVARESLANGFLSEKIKEDTIFSPGTLNARYSREEIVSRVRRVKELSFLLRDPVESMPQAALRWVLDNNNICSVLTGAKTSFELLDCTKASKHPQYSIEEHEKAKLIHEFDFSPA